MAKISIIVPVYNEEKSIAKCLTSILNQTLKDIEIIIVYYESQDHTLDIIKAFNDSRIKFIEQKDKTGAGGARNIGINASTGEYIGFVECEEIENTFFEKLYSNISKDESDIAVGSVTIIQNGDTTQISSYPEDSITQNYFDKFNKLQSGTCFEKLYRTDLIKQHSIYFPENLSWEDCVFTLEAFYYAKQVSFISDCNYVWKPVSWEGSYKQKLIDSIIPITQILKDFLSNKHLTSKEYDLFRTKMYKVYARNYFLEKNIYKNFVKLMGFSWYIFYHYLQMKKRYYLNKIKRRNKNG